MKPQWRGNCRNASLPNGKLEVYVLVGLTMSMNERRLLTGSKGESAATMQSSSLSSCGPALTSSAVS